MLIDKQHEKVNPYLVLRCSITPAFLSSFISERMRMRGNLYPALLDRWVDKPTKTLFGSGYAGLGF